MKEPTPEQLATIKAAVVRFYGGFITDDHGAVCAMLWQTIAPMVRAEVLEEAAMVEPEEPPHLNEGEGRGWDMCLNAYAQRIRVLK